MVRGAGQPGHSWAHVSPAALIIEAGPAVRCLLGGYHFDESCLCGAEGRKAGERGLVMPSWTAAVRRRFSQIDRGGSIEAQNKGFPQVGRASAASVPAGVVATPCE